MQHESERSFERAVRQLAQQLVGGQSTLTAFLSGLDQLRTAPLESATLDLDRARRCGFPEVVFAEGKSVESLAAIFQRMIEAGIEPFATRLAPDAVPPLTARFPQARYHPVARTLRIPNPARPEAERSGRVAVITAGTTDAAVAEEARETLDWMGVDAPLYADVGVAGPQRLLPHVASWRQCDAVVVAAGMEGALPSVVAGHVPCPVIAVPTSVGYGVNFGGLTPLLTMLNSCAANVAVVNIDAGFKAGYLAGLIARRRGPTGEP